MKYLIFDLDNTLCELGKPILPENVKFLHKLEDKGHKIVICSGKPTYYLTGLARQLGLKDIILIGENGAVIQYGVDIPPTFYKVVGKIKPELLVKFKDLKTKLDKAMPEGYWYQPDEVCFTVFPKNIEAHNKAVEIINSFDFKDASVYIHPDAIDIMSVDISKQAGIKALMDKENLSTQDIISIGDSKFDEPMFLISSLSYGIKYNHNVTKSFSSMNECLKYLFKTLK